MRKTVKPAEKCPTCGKTTKWDEVAVFCDQCDKQINNHPLRLTMFFSCGQDYEGGQTVDIELCSWDCVKQWLQENKSKLNEIWFVDFPNLIFNQEQTNYADSGQNFLKTFLQP